MSERSGTLPVRGFSQTGSDLPRPSSGTVVGIDGHRAALFHRHRPGQERSDLGRDSAVVPRTTLQEPRQPCANVDSSQGQSGKQGKEAPTWSLGLEPRRSSRVVDHPLPAPGRSARLAVKLHGILAPPRARHPPGPCTADRIRDGVGGPSAGRRDPRPWASGMRVRPTSIGVTFRPPLRFLPVPSTIAALWYVHKAISPLRRFAPFPHVCECSRFHKSVG